MFPVAADSSDFVQTELWRSSPSSDPSSSAKTVLLDLADPPGKETGVLIAQRTRELDENSIAGELLGPAVVLDRKNRDLVVYNDSVFPVDIVIAASLPTDAKLAHGFAQVRRDRDNGELKYTLRAIAKNAPWVRRIFLLVNGPQNMPAWVPEPSKTEFVDRCTLLPQDPNLPRDKCTRNGAVVQTVVHKVNGLSEHFIYTDDDNLLCLPAHIDDFYAGDDPRYWGEHTRKLYENPENTGLSESLIPMTVKVPDAMRNPIHTWFPLKKSSLEEFEKRYPEWLAFVRSHRVGRYTSRFNESGTAWSEEVNSLEELLNQGIWWWWLKQEEEEKKGALAARQEEEEVHAKSAKEQVIMEKDFKRQMHVKNTETERQAEEDARVKEKNDDTLGPDAWFRLAFYDTRTWARFQADPPFIQNINDDMPLEKRKYNAAVRVMVSTLEEMFPDSNKPEAHEKRIRAEAEAEAERRREEAASTSPWRLILPEKVQKLIGRWLG